MFFSRFFFSFPTMLKQKRILFPYILCSFISCSVCFFFICLINFCHKIYGGYYLLSFIMISIFPHFFGKYPLKKRFCLFSSLSQKKNICRFFLKQKNAYILLLSHFWTAYNLFAFQAILHMVEQVSTLSLFFSLFQTCQ